MRKLINCKSLIIFALAIILISIFIPSNTCFVQAAESVNGSKEACNVENFDFEFLSLDGDGVSTRANGNPKLLIFFSKGCYNSQQTISRLCQIDDYGDVDIVAIMSNIDADIDSVRQFKEQYGNNRDYIKFCYSVDVTDTDYALWEYADAVNIISNKMTFPMMVYIDSNNKVQYMTNDINTAKEIVDNLNKYCNAGIDVNMSPDIYKIANVVSGVHVYWNSTELADSYGLMRREAGTNDDFISIVATDKTHYIDTEIESGKSYEYIVYELDNRDNKLYMGESSKIVAITYVSTPDITFRANSAYGVRLGWNKISGATGYAIYRKPYDSGSWVRVTTIKGNSTFTWTDSSVKTNNGTVYKYTIRALAGSDMKTLSGCRNTGRTMTRLTSRTLNSAVKTSATSIKCNWTTTSVCNGYEVRFMVGSNVYKTFTVGNYKTGVKTFTGLKAGQTYKVQVRSYKKVEGVGTFYSAWSTEKMVTL